MLADVVDADVRLCVVVQFRRIAAHASMDIESQEGIGTWVTLRLPILEGDRNMGMEPAQR